MTSQRIPGPSLIRWLVVVTLVTAVIAACGSTVGSGSGPDTRLKVVTTTTVFADIISNVGGDRVSVLSISPAGAGPEDSEPKPDDAR